MPCLLQHLGLPRRRALPPPPSLHSSLQQGVRLTIASALPETGGVTHCGLMCAGCVLSLAACQRDMSVGGRAAYVVTLVSGEVGCQCRRFATARRKECKLTVVGRKVCSSSPSIPVGVERTSNFCKVLTRQDSRWPKWPVHTRSILRICTARLQPVESLLVHDCSQRHPGRQLTSSHGPVSTARWCAVGMPSTWYMDCCLQIERVRASDICDIGVLVHTTHDTLRRHECERCFVHQ